MSFAHLPALLILFALVCRHMPPVADDDFMFLHVTCYYWLHVTADTTVGCKRQQQSARFAYGSKSRPSTPITHVATWRFISTSRRIELY